MGTKTPWKILSEGDMTYLSGQTFLPDEERVLTIKDVTKETVDNHRGTVSVKWALHFEEDSLPMLLNAVNSKTLSKLYGSIYVEDWIGKKIQVFAPMITAFGETTPALRIRNFIPQTKAPEYKCCVCGKTISKDYYDGSIKKYGKPYCSAECHEADVNGKDYLKEESK